MNENACVPCEGGTPPLDERATKLLLDEVSGWSSRGPTESRPGSRAKIAKRFEFADFLAAMAFVDKMAALAEEEGHHPDFCVHYSRVDVTLWTHAVGGLSENDFILAAKIDGIVSLMSARGRCHHRRDRADRNGAGGVLRARRHARLGAGAGHRAGGRAAARRRRCTPGTRRADRRPRPAFEGVDVVVNLIGEPIAERRWNEARKKQLRDSRVVGTRALVDALRDLPQRPRLLISASGAGTTAIAATRS